MKVNVEFFAEVNGKSYCAGGEYYPGGKWGVDCRDGEIFFLRSCETGGTDILTAINEWGVTTKEELLSKFGSIEGYINHNESDIQEYVNKKAYDDYFDNGDLDSNKPYQFTTNMDDQSDDLPF